nr:hypothetical protein [Tanacetum cinerariifolium]
INPPSSRSSRSGQRSRHDSPEYDRCDGKVISRKYSDEPSPHHGRYESSRRTPGIAQVSLDSESRKFRGKFNKIDIFTTGGYFGRSYFAITKG